MATETNLKIEIFNSKDSRPKNSCCQRQAQGRNCCSIQGYVFAKPQITPIQNTSSDFRGLHNTRGTNLHTWKIFRICTHQTITIKWQSLNKYKKLVWAHCNKRVHLTKVPCLHASAVHCPFQVHFYQRDAWMPCISIAWWSPSLTPLALCAGAPTFRQCSMK